VALAACVLVPLLGVLRGQPAREMLLDGLTLAFATIPEELPILVTALVALGGLRLAQHGRAPAAAARRRGRRRDDRCCSPTRPGR
jgi:Ca2+-transporting ATPase